MNPAFKRIGITFQIGKQKYYGMAIASPDAIYLIMTQTRSILGSALAGGGGALGGGLLAGAIAAAGAKKAQPVRTCTYGELDLQVRRQSDWPFRAKSKHMNLQVLVVPRSAVDVIEHPSLTNKLTFKLAETPLMIEYLLLRGAKIRDYLNATGWSVKWRGKVLNRQSAA